MKKLLPLILLFVGVGGGVGAGMFLRPDPPAVAETVGEDEKKKMGEETAKEGSSDEDDKKKDDYGDTEGEKEEGANEFVKLNNQFVVPIVSGEKVVALVVLALSIEVPAGKTEAVYKIEPKLRDSFLQVLFDHANVGGFEGNFTDAQVLGRLRAALNEVAQKDLGRDNAKDVLIIEIARQDY